jgi:hypothetical protein
MKNTFESVRGDIGEAFIWLAVNEGMASIVHIIAEIFAGKLDVEIPSNPHLICSRVWDRTNHSTVAGLVNDGLKVTSATRVYDKGG